MKKPTDQMAAVDKVVLEGYLKKLYPSPASLRPRFILPPLALPCVKRGARSSTWAKPILRSRSPLPPSRSRSRLPMIA
jgi:hypothetical protein